MIVDDEPFIAEHTPPAQQFLEVLEKTTDRFTVGRKLWRGDSNIENRKLVPTAFRKMGKET